MTDSSPPPSDPPVANGTWHRSGAVARMLRMPVATLRVWERRYGLTQPALSPSGQRLYGADDVRRLALIKQLTDLGHAIGSLAGLDMAQLQQVAATHARTLAGRQAEPPVPTHPPLRRIGVIGPALASRLQRPALRQRLDGSIVVSGPYPDLTDPADLPDVDLLLIHAPTLHDGWQDTLPSTAARLAVVYRYASDAVCTALVDAGVALLRDPQPDAVLAQWLHAITRSTEPAPPRRWDDAALADFAGLSSTIACECPRHIAELLVQLSHFEAYSADCAHRSPSDAALHAHLHQVTASARARFEAALEAVARHEGLLLPGEG
ncbi:MerR family transcriptional regulator [Leptothrix sp. BB-4]